MSYSLRYNLPAEATEPVIIVEVFVPGVTRRNRRNLQLAVSPRLSVGGRTFFGLEARPVLENRRGTLYRSVLYPWRPVSNPRYAINSRQMRDFPLGATGTLAVIFGVGGYTQRTIQIASGVQTIRFRTAWRAGMSGTGMGETEIDGTEIDGGYESESGSGLATLGYVALGAGALYLLTRK